MATSIQPHGDKERETEKLELSHITVIFYFYFFLFSQEGKIAGRAVLIAGQPGTGKTAIAMGKMELYFICLL